MTILVDALLVDALFLLAGFIAGGAFFLLLKRNVTLYLRPQLRPRGLWRAIGLQALRLAALAGVLGLSARQGAPALLLAALGILFARTIVLRRAREAAP
ncbi:MAG: hypothetical protein M0002_02870 [Rhodospirillales bacterium]|nr:hypothetical protein [Rhodospirillales bacterium]